MSLDEWLSRLPREVCLNHRRTTFVDATILQKRYAETGRELSTFVGLSFAKPGLEISITDLVAAVEIAAPK